MYLNYSSSLQTVKFNVRIKHFGLKRIEKDQNYTIMWILRISIKMFSEK